MQHARYSRLWSAFQAYPDCFAVRVGMLRLREVLVARDELDEVQAGASFDRGTVRWAVAAGATHYHGDL